MLSHDAPATRNRGAIVARWAWAHGARVGGYPGVMGGEAKYPGTGPARRSATGLCSLLGFGLLHNCPPSLPRPSKTPGRGRGPKKTRVAGGLGLSLAPGLVVDAAQSPRRRRAAPGHLELLRHAAGGRTVTLKTSQIPHPSVSPVEVQASLVGGGLCDVECIASGLIALPSRHGNPGNLGADCI